MSGQAKGNLRMDKRTDFESASLSYLANLNLLLLFQIRRTLPKVTSSGSQSMKVMYYENDLLTRRWSKKPMPGKIPSAIVSNALGAGTAEGATVTWKFCVARIS